MGIYTLIHLYLNMEETKSVETRTDEEKSLIAMRLSHEMEEIGLETIRRKGNSGEFVWEGEEE